MDVKQINIHGKDICYFDYKNNIHNMGSILKVKIPTKLLFNRVKKIFNKYQNDINYILDYQYVNIKFIDNKHHTHICRISYNDLRDNVLDNSYKNTSNINVTLKKLLLFINHIYNKLTSNNVKRGYTKNDLACHYMDIIDDKMGKLDIKNVYQNSIYSYYRKYMTLNKIGIPSNIFIKLENRVKDIDKYNNNYSINDGTIDLLIDKENKLNDLHLQWVQIKDNDNIVPLNIKDVENLCNSLHNQIKFVLVLIKSIKYKKFN